VTSISKLILRGELYDHCDVEVNAAGGELAYIVHAPAEATPGVKRKRGA
jgi:hypothetical protein